MTKRLRAEHAGAAIDAACQLWSHSLAQAQTAARMATELACERVRLMSAPQEEYNIRRLRDAMIEAAQAGKSPLDMLRQAAEKGQLSFRWGMGQERASVALRAACKAVLAEIDGAALKASESFSQALADLEGRETALPEQALSRLAGPGR